MKKKSLKIDKLKVESFVTATSDDHAKTVKGGYITYACTAGWNGCNGGTGGGGGGGSQNTCNPNPFFTHRPCATFPEHCAPC